MVRTGADIALIVQSLCLEIYPQAAICNGANEEVSSHLSHYLFSWIGQQTTMAGAPLRKRENDLNGTIECCSASSGRPTTPAHAFARSCFP
jgi:hypothetical protein